MSEPVCPHTPGLPPRSCGECLFEGNFSAVPTAKPETERKNNGRPFRAKLIGECRFCSAGIKPGELIVDTGAGYAHHKHTAGGVR